jgi:UDP-N-acetylmuramoyl-L-alanyl-D-glutamate--2,6-diaminopimelate ligase
VTSRNEVTTPTRPHATLGELVQEIPGARLHGGDPALEIRDVRHDSRDVTPGDVFVARRGLAADGTQFAAQAVARGAAAVIADRPLAVPVPTLVAPDPDLALAIASSAVWRHPSFALDVVGITGTNGKTTTAWLMEHAMERLGMKAGLVGTVEHRYGALRWPAQHTTPEADDFARRAAAMRDAGAKYLVMEVSSHAIAKKRVAAVRFRVAVLTNVTQDHLDFHGTFEAYANAKRTLFVELGPAACVLNVDDAVGRDLSARIPSALGYSARGAEHAALRVLEARIDAGGIIARVATPQGEVALRSPLVGHHNLENLLAALGALIALDVPASRAAEALAEAKGAPGRLERVARTGEGGDLPDVFVDYAHTPDALSRVLAALRPMTRGRLVCVFGCGGDRDPSKRAPMGLAVAAGADVAVLTTDNPRTEEPARIADQAAEGLDRGGLQRLSAEALAHAGRGYVVELDRRRAIALAVQGARAGDVVLVAGKGHEPYQEVHGVRTPFDDRDEARAALAAREGR